MNDAKKLKLAGITYNLKRKNSNDDSQEEYDEPFTIKFLKQTIQALGISVPIEQNEKLYSKLAKIKPDFVFNICEGRGQLRSRESQVPCILESLNIPYYGSDPLALGITLDKHITNIVLKSSGIHVPDNYTVSAESDIKGMQNIFSEDKRYIIKPRWEGSSKGIFLNSVVSNFPSLMEKALFIINTYSQPAVIEEFLENEEITVGICGNTGSLEIIGMMKISEKKSSGDFIYSIENKREWRKKIKYEGIDKIEKNIQIALAESAEKAFSALELRDVARIDFRLDKYRIPKIIDINPLPGLSPKYSDLMLMCRLTNKNFSELVKKLFVIAAERNGFTVC